MMNKSGIEKALKKAVDAAPGLSFEKLSGLPYIVVSEHDFITRQTKMGKAGGIRRLSVAAALCLVLVAFMSGWYLQNRVSSIITLDVNPGIEIKVAHSERILSVRAINQDAVAIIGNRKLKGTKLSETVPLLINSLVEHQYINKDKNAILLTITDKNTKKAIQLKDQMDRTIRESLLAWNITPTVLSQTLNKKNDRRELANRYDLSEGKLQLIQDIIASNSQFTLDNLAGKSIEQLYQLATDNSMDLSSYLKQDEVKSYEETRQKKDGEAAVDIKPSKQAGGSGQDSYMEEDKEETEEDNTKQDNYFEERNNGEQDSDERDSGKQVSDKKETKNRTSGGRNGKEHTTGFDIRKNSKPAAESNSADHKDYDKNIRNNGDNGDNEDGDGTQDKDYTDTNHMGDEDNGQAQEVINGEEDENQQTAAGDIDDDVSSGGGYEGSNKDGGRPYLTGDDEETISEDSSQENGMNTSYVYSNEDYQKNENNN